MRLWRMATLGKKPLTPSSFTLSSILLMSSLLLVIRQPYVYASEQRNGSAKILEVTDYLIALNTSISSNNSLLHEDETFIWFPGPKSSYSPFVAAFLTLLMVIVIVGTIIGNILVCIAVCLVRKLRRPCNYLLVSLAVSDLCVAVLVMPMAMLYEILGYWPFGVVVCNLWVSFDVLSCTASILNLCMISVDRYYAITKPLEYGIKRTPRRMIFHVFLVWLCAACISLPPLLILGNESKNEQCGVSQNFGYQIYATLGSFYIPLLVMIVVYYKIFRAARKIVMDEKRAQSHLETHCYLEINGKNEGGTTATAEATIVAAAVAAGPRPTASRGSTASTNTTCSTVDRKSSSIGRCFSTAPRKSNESQCPMLQQPRTPAKTIHCINQAACASPNPGKSKGKRRRTSSEGLAAATNRIRNSLTNFGTKHTTQQSPHQKKLRFQLAKERKASTTLGIIMSAFIFCWFPFFVLALVRPFLNKIHTEIPKELSGICLWLGYVNSLLNPIIYATLNKDFRKPFQEILYFRCSNLNLMMREEFYHSQYGDPEQHYCVVNSVTKMQNYDGVEIVTTDERDEETRASESFL